MAQYVDIMTDAGFKAVFQDKQVTIKFLNAALAGERQIKDITYLDKEIKPEIVENRTIIFDLLCEDVSGAKFILEMQNCPQYYFFNRGFYYLCRMVARQGQIGKQWQYRLRDHDRRKRDFLAENRFYGFCLFRFHVFFGYDDFIIYPRKTFLQDQLWYT